MEWLMLIIAGFCEVGFTTCLGKMKEASGVSIYWWMGGFFGCLVANML